MSSSQIGQGPNIAQMQNSQQSLEGPKKIDDVSSSVNKQIKTLEDSLVTGYDLLQLFKEEADQISKEIDVMMNVLIEKTEVVQDELHVETRKDYKQLKSDIKAQRDENEILYKGLKNVVQSTDNQKKKIAVYQAKIEELEQHVGILGNSPDPHFTSMQNLAPATQSAIYTHDAGSGEGAWDEQPTTSDPIKVQRDVTKLRS